MTRRTRLFVLAGLVVTLVLAGVVSYYASRSPDGLNRVAIDKGLDTRGKAHASRDSPLAGYATRGVNDPRLSRGVAGVAGVVVTFLVAGGVLLVVRRRNAHPDASGAPDPDGDRNEGAGTAGSRP